MARHAGHYDRKVGREAAPQRSKKRKREDEDLAALEAKVREMDVSAKFTTFSDLPLSTATKSGLAASNFKQLTAIQRGAIPLALRGNDILGAAKTGSGKTLSFLIPVLDRLKRQNWGEFDGLGALILSPTRELAIQIFEVLTQVGRYHTFSAGLVIGGKSEKEEKERLSRMNILVATPGRILQHLDETMAFEVGNLQCLVLDEADRILDMGFKATIDGIIEHLPRDRQTLLFSATQTKRVSDLARLSLKDPEYVAVHEAAASATPETLKQSYIRTPLPEKFDVLWSFLRANVKAKILCFLSSGKQVRWVYEAFRHLRPGVQLMHIHGRQRQSARLDITKRFAATKNACLFATDVAARGLDFPAVDWVLQVDCPEDAETYIHRVGRTARFERDGRAVLFLDPSEETAMVKRLRRKKVAIEQIQVRQNKKQSIRSQLQNMCFQRPEIKYLGQKAFVSYCKSVNIQKDKEVFDLQKLSLEEYAASLGLPGAPRIKFQKGDDAKRQKNASRRIEVPSEDEESNPQQKPKTVRTKYDRMFERQNQDILSSHYADLVDQGEQKNKDISDGEDGVFFNIKRRQLATSPSPVPERAERRSQQKQQTQRSVALAGGRVLPIDSKRREKLLQSKKCLLKYQGKGSKLVFDEEGNPHEVYEMKDEEDFKEGGNAEDRRQRFVGDERARIEVADLQDKTFAKEKRKAKKDRRKERESLLDESVETRAVLAASDEDEDGGNDTYLSDDDKGSEEKEPERNPHKFREKNSKRRRREPVVEDEVSSQGVENLEDLEALASKYL